MGLDLWHHAAFGYEGTVCRSYLNGKKVREATWAVRPHSDTSPIRIGKGAEPGTAFRGLIRELRLWKVARTDEQIEASADAKLRGDEPGLVGYWDFSEGEGDVLHDRSSVRNHGAIKGAKWVTLDETPPTPRPAVQPEPGEWVSLFDGKTLDGWKGPKELHVEDGQLVMEIGKGARGGFAWTGEFPKIDYELELDLVKTEGTNVCGLILPVGESPAALGIADHDIGLGSVNKKMPFPRGKWFRLRVRVTQPKVQVWVDDALVIDLPTEGEQFGIWSGFQGLRPFGIHTRTTRIALRSIRLRSLAPGAAEAPKPGEWQSLFDGKSLEGWTPLREGEFQQGKVGVQDGLLVVEGGRPVAGIAASRDMPKIDYELAFEAKRDGPTDVFCQIVFPIGGSACCLVVGGYRGVRVGLEFFDGRSPDRRGSPADKVMKFEDGRWYSVRLRVTQADLAYWVDDEKLFETPLAGHTFTMHRRWNPLKPLGLLTGASKLSLRNIRLRRVEPGAAEAPKAGEWQNLFDGKTLDGRRLARDHRGRHRHARHPGQDLLRARPMVQGAGQVPRRAVRVLPEPVR